MSKINSEFVPYSLALRMKALGYDEPCMAYFLNSILQCTAWEKDYSYFNEMSDINPSLKKHEHVLAPTWQSAFAWFRDNYKIDSAICKHTGFKSKPYTLDIIKNDNDVICDYDNDEDLKTYNSYEEAKLACLEKLCEIVEQKKKGYEK